MAAKPQAMAAMTKEMETAGPAVVAAARAVRVKMPAPMTTATPKTVRSNAERVRLSLWPGSSVSLIDCSTDLVRQMLPAMTIALPLTFYRVIAELTISTTLTSSTRSQTREGQPVFTAP